MSNSELLDIFTNPDQETLAGFMSYWAFNVEYVGETLMMDIQGENVKIPYEISADEYFNNLMGLHNTASFQKLVNDEKLFTIFTAKNDNDELIYGAEAGFLSYFASVARPDSNGTLWIYPTDEDNNVIGADPLTAETFFNNIYARHKNIGKLDNNIKIILRSSAFTIK